MVDRDSHLEGFTVTTDPSHPNGLPRTAKPGKASSDASIRVRPLIALLLLLTGITLVIVAAYHAGLYIGLAVTGVTCIVIGLAAGYEEV
jgi:hypothetical protein